MRLNLIALAVVLLWPAAPSHAEIMQCGGPITTDPCLTYGMPFQVKVGVICNAKGKSAKALNIIKAAERYGLIERDRDWVRQRIDDLGCMFIGPSTAVAPVDRTIEPDAEGFIQDTEVILFDTGMEGNLAMRTYFNGHVGERW